MRIGRALIAAAVAGLAAAAAVRALPAAATAPEAYVPDGGRQPCLRRGSSC